MNQIKYYLPLNILIAEPSKSPAKAQQKPLTIYCLVAYKQRE